MSFHTSHHYYALCDHYDGDQRCENSLVPAAPAEATSPHDVLVPRGAAFNAVKAAGWEVTYLGEGVDRLLCPHHLAAVSPASPVDVVDVPLFDLVPNHT